MLEKLTPRQFEVLSANYVKYIAPQYNWTLTKSTSDFNRDMEAFLFDKNIWGEAKHTKDASSSVSKTRWDPTILSALLRNNVDEIYLVTCGNIPLEYIVRAEHLKSSHIRKINYINRYILDEWLCNCSIKFDNFSEKNFNINTLIKSLQTEAEKNETYPDRILVNCFDLIENNMLEPQKKLIANIFYELNITFFTSSKNSKVCIEIPENFLINEFKLKHLSINKDEELKEFDMNSKKINCQVYEGFSQILIYGFFLKEGQAEIIIELNQKHYKKAMMVNKSILSSNDIKQEIIIIENSFHSCVERKNNNILDVYYCNKNDLNRQFEKNDSFGKFYAYSFEDHYENNAKVLCQLMISLLLNIDFRNISQENLIKIVNGNINFCDFWLLDLAIGCSNDIFALDFLEHLNTNEKLRSIIIKEKARIENNSMILIENTNYLSSIQKNALDFIKVFFVSSYNSSLMIINSNKKINEATKKIKFTYEYLMDLAKKHYDKTDFYVAAYYYKILLSSNENASIFLYYNYADCLNHCGSMTKSLQLFEKVITCSNIEIFEEKKKMIEAQTEIFNIRFWNMETTILLDDIDKFYNKHHDFLLEQKNYRDIYSLYNLLNRKMVTLYLMGKYDEAEKMMQYNLNTISTKNENYIAFAYMDSARGLYKKNIYEARCRMKKALSILSKPNVKNKELRRYYDCKVELAFINFILDYKLGTADITSLEKMITKVKLNGYKNMLIKCYLKLATCYLALQNLNLAEKCLSFVKKNCDFKENLRSKWLYNSIISNYYLLDNLKENITFTETSDYCNYNFVIGFNCFNQDGDVILETRVW